MRNSSFLFRLLGLLLIVVTGCARPTPTPRLAPEPAVPEERAEKKAIRQDKIIFSKAPEYMELPCKSCHRGMKYEHIGLEEKKVGPTLKKMSSKVNSSWLFRWVEKPGNYRKISGMPCFGLSINDVLGTTAFIMNQSDKDYNLPLKFTPTSNPETGRLLFERIGCIGCHKVNGIGSDYAPNLSRIANKVYPDWEYNWLINQAQYDDQTIMPNFRLSKNDAREIVTYLMTLGKREDVEGLDEKIKSPELIALGEKIIIRKGCYGCHKINLEHSEGLTTSKPKTLSIRSLLEKEFGTYKIKKIREELILALSSGSSSAGPGIERVSPTQQNVILPNEEDNLFRKYNHRSEKAVYIREGLRIIKKYNCRGCHTILGEGGKVAPVLDYEGKRAQTKFIFDFLINPRRIRPVTLYPAKMPKFNLKLEEVVKLVAFLKAISNVPIFDQSIGDDFLSEESLQKAKKAAEKSGCDDCGDQDWLKRPIYGGHIMREYVPVDGENEHVTKGRNLFLYYCASCHGKKGRGDGFNSAYLDPVPRDLSDQREVYMAKQKNERLFKVITYGGKSIDKSPRMPPFGNTLSEKERWEIIAYMRTLNSYNDEVIDFENGGFSASQPKTEFKKVGLEQFKNVKKRDMLKGRGLFYKLGCLACHTVGSIGGKVGPNLTYAGTRLRGPWVYQYLKSPYSLIENVQMPNFGLSDDKALRLTYYLLSLK